MTWYTHITLTSWDIILQRWVKTGFLAIQLLHHVYCVVNCTFHHDTSPHPYRHGGWPGTQTSHSHHEISHDEHGCKHLFWKYSCYTMCTVLLTVNLAMTPLHIPTDMVDDLVHTHHTHIMRYHMMNMGANRLLSNTAVTPCVLCCSL